jgi:hypothetical protein
VIRFKSHESKEFCRTFYAYSAGSGRVVVSLPIKGKIPLTALMNLQTLVQIKKNFCVWFKGCTKNVYSKNEKNIFCLTYLSIADKTLRFIALDGMKVVTHFPKEKEEKGDQGL